MALTPYPFSFGDLGSRLDELISGVEKQASGFVPRTEAIRTVVKNTVPHLTGNFNVDVYENENDIVVLCDLPGFEKEQISVRLVNETTLSVTTEAGSAEDVFGTCHLRERRLDAGKRTIILPAAVSTDGARATFKNGIMEIILPKINQDLGTSIPIE